MEVCVWILSCGFLWVSDGDVLIWCDFWSVVSMVIYVRFGYKDFVDYKDFVFCVSVGIGIDFFGWKCV